MTSTVAQTDTPNAYARLRLWPGVVAVALQWLAWFVFPVLVPEAGMYGMLAGVVAAGLIVLWWLFFSRAPWLERVGALVLMIVALPATKRIVHESIANGMMGMMLFIHAIPVLSLALVAGAVAGRRLSGGPRRASMVAAIVLACATFTLLRTGGISGEGQSDLHWRWTPTPEERLLARAGDTPEAPPSPSPPTTAGEQPAARAGEAPAAEPPPAVRDSAKRREGGAGDAPAALPPAPAGAPTTADWPGFRGPGRDGVVRGVRIGTDWSASPPVELWRRPVGPGWSSFAVRGDLFYTQEQRGEHELVTCYSLDTGQPVWSHRDAARFWESNGGAGPRATPTLSGGRVFTLGGTGILNALDAGTGALAWSRNAASDTGAENPGWGFAGSPLVWGDMVVVAASGRLAAYDATTGDQRWLGPEGGAGYSSPHLATIDGVAQILLLRGSRSTSVAPTDGTLLWEHVAQPGVSILQPALAADGDILIAGGDAMGGTGLRRMAIARGPDGWTVAERWTSRGLKPYFNDFVVHQGHAFGFDGSILASVDLADGQRKWKGGRYGHGQMIVLPDQDVLLVLSEEGEVALVAAAPDQYREFSRFKAIEGKTWNHPVLVGDILLVRNGEEMAAFRLPLEAAGGD
jgi:outer membrane protein assembly factor BamB